MQKQLEDLPHVLAGLHPKPTLRYILELVYIPLQNTSPREYDHCVTYQHDGYLDHTETVQPIACFDSLILHAAPNRNPYFLQEQIARDGFSAEPFLS